MSGLFHGLSAFPLTPADEKGRVDTDAFCALLERIDAAGADSIGILGSTGSYVYLSRAERRRAIDAAVRLVNGRRPVIAGIGALRTDEVQALARDAQEAGADGLLLAPVSYQVLTRDEVFGLFEAVAQATTLPVCIYNNPSTTRFAFSEDLIGQLSVLENVAAVKMPLPVNDRFAEEITRLRSLTGENFAIGYSGDWGCADALLAGADSWYSVVGGLLPVPALALTRAAQKGDAAEAARINSFLQPLWGLFREFGSYRVMYAAAKLLSIPAGQPPLPVRPVPDAALPRIQAALDVLDTEI